MRFSVIIPVYNGKRTIVNTLQSIWNTGYDDYECIVVDDGSKDETLALCHSFTDGKPNFRVCTKENKGVSSARNVGISLAKGDWILFVDADDAVVPTYFQDLATKCNDRNDLVVLGYTFKGKNFVMHGPLTANKTKEDFLCLFLNHPKLLKVVYSKAYRRELIAKHDIKFNEDIHLGEDYLFCLDYLTVMNHPAIVEKSLYIYAVPSKNNLSRRHYPIQLILKKTQLIMKRLSTVFKGEHLLRLYKKEATTLVLDVYLSDKLEPKDERIKAVKLIRDLGAGFSWLPIGVEDSVYKTLFYLKKIKKGLKR